MACIGVGGMDTGKCQLASGPLFFDKPEKERYHGKHYKHKEQDFGNADGSRRDAAEAEQRGDQCNDQKNDCVVKHDSFLKGWASGCGGVPQPP